MPVADDQVATLRSLLTRDYDDHARGLDRIISASDRESYTALVAAGFTVAATRRFRDASVSDIVAYIAEVRSRSQELCDLVDPTVAEKLIRGALGDGSADSLSDKAVVDGQTVLLPVILSDVPFNDAALDKFLADVRSTADRWLSES